MSNSSAFADFLKVVYAKGVPELEYRKRPLLDMIKKTRVTDDKYDVTVAVSDGNSGSGDPSVTFASTSTNVFEKFEVLTAEWYEQCYQDNKDWVKSIGSVKAMGKQGDLFKKQVEAKRQNLMNKIAWNLYNPYVGAVDTISAISGTTFTLSNARSHRNLKEGATLYFASTDGSSGAVESGTVTVSTINKSTGVVTCTGNVTDGIASATTGMYVFPAGHFGKGFYGLGKWGESPTASESFYGADRTDYRALQFTRYTVTGDRVDGLIDALDQLYDDSEECPDYVFVNPIEYAKLAKALQPDVVQNPNGGKIGFDALTVQCSGGAVKVLGDGFCPQTMGVACQLKDLELIYNSRQNGKFIELQDNIGPIAVSNADKFTVRLNAYCGLAVHRPNRQMIITFS